MSKYASNLQKSDAQKAAEVVDFQVGQAKAGVASSKASLQGQLAQEKQTVEQLKSQFPLDVQAIVNASFAIKETEEALSVVTSLEAELFN